MGIQLATLALALLVVAVQPISGKHKVVKKLESPRTTDWGWWHEWETCPDGMFAQAI